MKARPRMFWAAVWLAFVLLAIKAYYLGSPAAATPHAAWDYLRDLAAVSFVDALFAACFWVRGSAALILTGDRPRLFRVVTVAAMICGAISCLYASASVIFFGVRRVHGASARPMTSISRRELRHVEVRL